jgi:hypothetical protein
MIRPLLLHVAMGKATEFVIYDGDQTVKRFLLAAAPG